MIREGWTTRRLGELFINSKARGKPGLPTLSVTMNDGLVSRDTLERKMETNLGPDQHLLVRKGDLAYNMMRMWQGASGLATFDGMVSPAYVVLRAGPDIDPQFAAYLFKHPRMIHLFWAYSHGMTEDRLRLYFDDFALIPIELPSLGEQRRAAEMLSTWERAIETVEGLISNTEAHKSALIQMLLTGQRRLPGFTSLWRQAPFGTFARLEKRRVDPSTLSATEEGVELEHIESDTGRLIGTTPANAQASLKTPFSPDDVLYGKLRPYLRKFFKPNFSGVCSTEIWVLKPNTKDCLPEYLHLLVQTPAFNSATAISSGSKMPRADWGVVSETRFALPPLSEQKAIAECIEALAGRAANLEDQRFKLRQERAALMQQLLAGKRRTCVQENAE